MADDVTLPGSGAIIAADEIAGKKHQRIKVQFGDDGVATDVSATNPLPVVMDQSAANALTGAVNETAPGTDTASSGLNGRLQRIAQRLTSLIALFPTSLGAKADSASLAVTQSTQDAARVGATNETAAASDSATSGLNGLIKRGLAGITSLIAGVGAIGDAAWASGNGSVIAMLKTIASAAASTDPATVVGASAVVSATPTVSTTAYAAGDCIGGKLTFAGMARANGLTGLIQTAMIQCKSAQTFAADLIVFHTDPAASTFTDNAALALNAADFDKVALRIPFVAGDWSNLGTPSIAEVSAQGKQYKAAAGATTLYGVLVARGTPTLGSTSDLKVVVKAMLD